MYVTEYKGPWNSGEKRNEVGLGEREQDGEENNEALTLLTVLFKYFYNENSFVYYF